MGMYQKVKEGVYSMKSLLIHGRFRTEKWDFQHHVVPPLSSSTAYRLDSVERGAKGFSQFASVEPSEDAPVYIYDRLGEPCRDMLEERLAFAEKGEMGITFSSGMGAIAASLGIHVFPGQKMISSVADPLRLLQTRENRFPQDRPDTLQFHPFLHLLFPYSF